MNEIETAQFAVGGSLVMACLILGMIITELLRKCLEDAVFEYLTATESQTLTKALKQLEEQAKWSKEDRD